MLAWFSSGGSQRNRPCSSAVILSHAVPNCGWLIYWSATLLFFLCLLLLMGGSVSGASFIFWPFTCEFPQSSWSINNPLAHDQNSIPVLPPAQRAIVTESGCLWMRLKKIHMKTTWKVSLQLLETFLCGRGTFYTRRQRRWVSLSPPTLCSRTVHEVVGVKIANQSMVIEPLGWETGTDSIKSAQAGNKVYALAKSVTPGFNQVLCGKTWWVGELLMSRLELVRGRREKDGRIKAAPNSDS